VEWHGYVLGVDLEEAVKGHKRVLVQAPDGLKGFALKVAEELGGMGVDAFVSGSHAWGGCDVAFGEAERVGATLILHIGHHGPVRFKMPDTPTVVFAPAYLNRSPAEALRSAARLASERGYRRVVLGMTVQHVRYLHHAVAVLEEEGLEAAHFPGPLGIEGLVIGCDYSSLRGGFDAAIIVAAGRFHPLGAALWTGKPAIAADPYAGSAWEVDAKPYISRHLYSLSKAVDAESFLVVVSTKPGQENLRGAEKAAAMLREAGKKVEIAVFDEVSREALVNLGGFDAYINSACPRLVVDDPHLFPGPAVNVGETRFLTSGNVEEWRPRDLFRLYP